MNMRFLGTGAAELYPNPYCDCEVCERARRAKEIRLRSAFLLNEHNMVDFGVDVLAASALYDIPLYAIENVFITHTHPDHFCLDNIGAATMAGKRSGHWPIRFYLSASAKAWLEQYLAAVRPLYGGASEVDALLNRFYSHEAQEDEFDADAAQEKITENGGPVTQPGGLWALGEHRLLCADPTGTETYEKLLGNERAQCAVTSPPVDAKEYARDGLEPWLKRMAQVIRLLARYAEVVCWQAADLMQTGSPFVEPLAMHAMKLFADETLRPLWIRVWKMTGNVPTAGALQAASNKPAPQFDCVTAYASGAPEAYNDQEYAWVSAFAEHSFQFVKRLTREERRKWGYAGVWEISAMRKQNGETQIPIELPWRCLKMHTDVHGLALDPFAGLGSTLIACEQSGRRCRAIEADALHCDLIVRRWEQFTGEQAIRL